VNEREEARRRMLEEYLNIPKESLEFVLSLPVERKIPKVTKMERLLLKKNDEKE
jgi:hypothetical protein